MRKTLALLGFLAFTSTAQAAPPSSPPELTTPPPVATSGFVTAYVEETIPLNVKQTRSFLNKNPIVRYLRPTKNISNPVGAKTLQGVWPQTGAVRRIKLEDGHYVIERVVKNTQRLFKYQIFTFTNATGRGVEQIVGEMNFVPVNGGTEFQWSYNVKPKNAFTRPFVRARIGEIEGYIGGGLAGFAEAARKSVGQ